MPRAAGHGAARAAEGRSRAPPPPRAWPPPRDRSAPTLQHADVGAVGVAVACLGGAGRGGDVSRVARLEGDAGDVAGEVVGAGRAQPQLVRSAHRVLQRLAVDAVDDQRVALLDVGQRQAHLIAVRRRERDGVGVGAHARLAHDVHQRDAGDLGVGDHALVGAVAGAGAAHLHRQGVVVGKVTQRRGEGARDVAVDLDRPLVNRDGGLVGARQRVAQEGVGPGEGALDCRVAGQRRLVEPELPDNLVRPDLRGDPVDRLLHNRGLLVGRLLGLGRSRRVGERRGDARRDEQRGPCKRRRPDGAALRARVLTHGYSPSLALEAAAAVASAEAEPPEMVS